MITRTILINVFICRSPSRRVSVLVCGAENQVWSDRRPCFSPLVKTRCQPLLSGWTLLSTWGEMHSVGGERTWPRVAHPRVSQLFTITVFPSPLACHYVLAGTCSWAIAY